MKRVSVYVDVQNIYYTVKQMYNSHFNYLHFLKTVTAKRQLIKATAYATRKKDDSDQKRFQELLAKFGFKVKLIDYAGEKVGKDWDQGICMDLLQDCKNLDCIVLVTGDGDFEEVVRQIKATHSVDVEVYGVPGLTAKNLIVAADAYYPIDAEFLIAIPQRW